MDCQSKISLKRALEIVKEYKNSDHKFQSLDYKELLNFNVSIDRDKKDYIRFYYGIEKDGSSNKQLKFVDIPYKNSLLIYYLDKIRTSNQTHPLCFGQLR